MKNEQTNLDLSLYDEFAPPITATVNYTLNQSSIMFEQWQIQKPDPIPNWWYEMNENKNFS